MTIIETLKSTHNKHDHNETLGVIGRESNHIIKIQNLEDHENTLKKGGNELRLYNFIIGEQSWTIFKASF
jgi:hypothetical protein